MTTLTLTQKENFSFINIYMANKVFRDMLKPQAHLSRNGFDRSYLHNFTAKIGELLPVMSVETVPGSHYEIKVSDLMRTVPMYNAAFIRAMQHFEFYFVPYKQLWHKWDDFYTTRSQPTRAGESFAIPQAAPNASLYDILSQIKQYASIDDASYHGLNYGDIGERIGAGADKIANLLGYPCNKQFANGIGSPLTSPVAEYFPNVFRPAAYQKICYDYYRQPFYDLPYEGVEYTFNLDDADLSTGRISSRMPYKLVSGYTECLRFPRLFQLHYRQWKKDLFTGVLPDTQFGMVSSVTFSAPRFASDIDIFTDGGSVMRAFDSDGEPLASQSALFTDSDGNLKASPSGVDAFLSNDPDIPQIYSYGTIPKSILNGSLSGTGSFDVLALVRAQAIQQWRQTTLRSGFRNTDQYQGHFGVTPVFTEKDRCVFIDSVSSPLQVNSVVQTSASGDTPLGDMAANGTAVVSSDKTIKFDAKDFGVLMCIYSVLPEATYDAQGIDLMNQKILRDDFFTPEYENIGLRIVPMSAFRIGGNNLSNGFAARYAEYKVGLDVQTAEFWRAYVGSGSDITNINSGAFDGWSPARLISTTNDNGITSPRLFARDLYVSPMYYADIFTRLPYKDDPDNGLVPANTLGDSAYDPFMHQCYFDIKCVQPMSVLGMPQF